MIAKFDQNPMTGSIFNNFTKWKFVGHQLFPIPIMLKINTFKNS
jgi:hypothetical protein